MNMHQLHQKYRNADHMEIINDPDFKHAFNSIQLFNKGDFGMLIVPPATEEFALAIAISTCGVASDRVGGIKVPKLKSCVFIDTLIRKVKLKKDVQNAESYIGRALPKGFKLVTAKDVYSSSFNKNKFGSENGNTFEYVTNFIENKYSDVQGIFVMLDSVIFAPNNFVKTAFDKFLAWASEIKKQGKTLVVISQYQIPQTKYLADHMNFVINCIPDQRGASCGMCTFAVQWLKFNTDSDVDLTACRSINLVQDQCDTIQYKVKDQENSTNPHFYLNGHIDYYEKRGWCRAGASHFLSSYSDGTY
jgi:hypothetical protein